MFGYQWNIPLYCGDIGKKTKSQINKLKNNITFQNTFSRLCLDALDNRYDIDGLPDTVSKRVVLQSFLWYGACVFFEKGGSILALPAVPTGNFNIYGDPGAAFVFSRLSSIGFNKQVKLYIPGGIKDSFLEKTSVMGKDSGEYKGVMVWENRIRYPFISQVIFFAQRIADTLRTMDVCMTNIKTPYIMVAEESVVPTVRKFIEARDNNDETWLSSGIFDPSKIQVLPIQTPAEVLPKCTEVIEWYEAKFRELCGVENNAQMDKKGENLHSAEISVNDMYTEFSVDRAIACIKEGLDLVNSIYGTEITVKARYKDYDNRHNDISTKESGNPSVRGVDGDNTD